MTTTYVCSYKDIECGSKPENWCSKCPLKLRTNEPKGVAMTESQKAFPPSADTLEHAILEDKLLNWWLSQRNSFAEFQELVAKFEAYGRKQALEEITAEREQVAENIKQIEIGELKP